MRLTTMASDFQPILVKDLSTAWDGERVHAHVSLLLQAGRVVAMGQDVRHESAITIDGRGLVAMPGLVDCHTHSVFAGTRLGDFVRRLGGEHYADILQGGGGIHTTVVATRAATVAELTTTLTARLRGMRARGVTCVEIKSGYGLDCPTELRMLQAARTAGNELGIDISPTFLGAHAVPAGQSREHYLAQIVGPMLEACAPHCEAIDVYCDRGAFTLAEAETVLRAGKAAGLAIRAHAEQVEYTGIAELAARLGAASCDHLERIDDAGIAAMAQGGTVAVLLPGAMLYLRDQPPPVSRLRSAGAPLAVATDFNPGSSPVSDLWTCATLACLTMGLTAEEALAGITSVAARALGRHDRGHLRPGAVADVALFSPPPGEIADPRVLVQYMGGHRVHTLIVGGRVVEVP